MFKINVLNENKIIECAPGSNLYMVLSQNGLMDAPCGGTGTCGKCKVRLLNLEELPTDHNSGDFFTAEELARGWRLACLCQVTGDINVELPPQSHISSIVSQGYMKNFVHSPLARQVSTPDGHKLLFGDSVAVANAADNMGSCYGIAIDIGTTTVVASLVDLAEGREIESLSCLNRQKAFGQDVISRIHYAATHADGTEVLQKAIIKDLCNLINELCRRQNISEYEIYDITVAANTTMIHLLGGINPESLGKSPYIPGFQGVLSLNGRDLGLPVSPYCQVYCLPAISSFVGGDIAAGILACGLEDPRNKLLFIDIGTNGEMVLADGDRFYSCSCAAGPALEGMNISCGVRAQSGAIEDLSICIDKVQYKTIGGESAIGICGSGLLAAVAEMLKAGIIDKRGRLLAHGLVETAAGKKRFVIDAHRNLYLTQHDIRQVQLAKGAILSGIYTLLQSGGMQAADLKRVVVAGQFGAHLKADSLIGAGLLPPDCQNIISYVGNTSKSGAMVCLLSDPERRLVESIANNIDYIELSQVEGYDHLFVKCMQFD